MDNLKQLERNNRILITGTSRTGKSWLKDWTIKKYDKLNKRRFFVAIDDNINNCKALIDKGFQVEEIDRNNIFYEYDYRNFLLDNEKVVFILNDLVDEEIAEFIGKITNIIWTLGDTLFVIDEAWQYINKYTNPKPLIRVIRGGAKVGIDTMIISHRLQDIPTQVISLLNTIISFRLVEDNTIQKIKQYYNQFTLPDNKHLIDNDLKKSQKKKCKDIIKSSDITQILRNLPNRYFLYSDTVEGIQEITSSNNLQI